MQYLDALWRYWATQRSNLQGRRLFKEALPMATKKKAAKKAAPKKKKK
jgi:hypothetical protein